jgi:2-polyprenyl-6-methoxyphenol hydroxylase-like FAD-dependent oxidoreductase
METKKFAIVGGGIGGLTLAIALQRKGFDVTIYENAPEIKPLGAGLGLAVNAVKAVMEIGIGDEVLRAGKVMKSIYLKDEKGNILSETDSEKLSAKFGSINNFTIHRADLHRALLSELAPQTLQLGKGCIDFKQTSGGITLYFHDGSRAEADYLIACDGIHSMIRQKLLPGSAPRYAGYTCWRGVINEIPRSINPDETSETWGNGSRFGIAPLTNNRLYWYACLNARPNDPMLRSFTIQALLTYFGNYHAPVSEILKKTKNEQLIWGDIMDIKPIRKFAFGRIVLMGDAAHASTPNMGQGACMAIEDAAVLSNCLEHYATAEEAFEKFESKRIARTTKIVNTSRTIGKIAQWENPLLTTLRNTMMRLTPPGVTERQMKFLTEISFV